MSAAPESKNPNEVKGPLAHLKVLELAGLAPAPFCGLLLKQFGADVVHINRTGGAPEDPAGLALGKRSLAVDLKSKEGIEVLRCVRAACSRALTLPSPSPARAAAWPRTQTC
jgi:alpha-methylacyl-CoA racemase